MAKKKNVQEIPQEFDVINLKALTDAANVDYHKTRFNLVGRYAKPTLTANEHTLLVNALYEKVSKTFEYLGFSLPPPQRIK